MLEIFLQKTKELVSDQLKIQCNQIKKLDIPDSDLIADRILKYTLEGKFLRAMLLRLSAQSFGYENEEHIIRIAASLELAQTALLIHDDVIDNDSFRRGSLAMHKVFENDLPSGKKNSEIGKSLAICAGDLVLFHLFSQIADHPDIVVLFSKKLSATALGQYFEIYNNALDTEISREQILFIMKNKTSEYSFSLPISSGAILAQKYYQYRTLLERFSLLAGYIFQIRDDELNLLSHEHTGKSSGCDILENKKTLCRYELLLSYPQVTSLFHSLDYIKEIQSLYITTGAKEKIDDCIHLFQNECNSIICQLRFTKYFERIWLELLQYLVDRKK